jgi:hypothetical protein
VKYGYPQFDIVAMAWSAPHVAVRSAHKVVGLLTVVVTVVNLVRIWHVLPAATPQPLVRSQPPLASAAAAGGRG